MNISFISFIHFIPFISFMVTESLIRKKFVHETMTEGIDKIFTAQQRAFQATFSPRTGRLQQMLASRPYERRISDSRYTVYIRMYTYLRFLDMQYRRQDGQKRRKKGLIYNKVVWPILFREVFPELRYGLTDEVRTSLRQQLESALKPAK